MRLLIVTQVLDEHDPVLGFFVRWVAEFAKHAERVTVVCLKKGAYTLPENVQVFSLGKEHSAARRTVYAWRFLRLAWQHRHIYDTVFVHMNQEYILIAGWLWKLLGKRVSMWRNHYAGSFLTDMAAAFCTHIFCTSRHSYTAKYRKTILMPVGVDTEAFHPDTRITRVARSVLFLARMAPSKHPDVLLDALAMLKRDGVAYTATFVGSPLPQDTRYYASLQEKAHTLGLADRVTFRPGVPKQQTPDIYRVHEVFVNCSQSGMFDKTIFEAAACGCQVLASSDDWRALVGDTVYFDSSDTLAARLREGFISGAAPLSQDVVESNSLTALGNALARIMSTP